MSSIQVAVRCRPFTINDRLGVTLQQTSEDEGEINLINTEYTTTRFAFSYAWWTAYGYKRRAHEDDLKDCESMKLIDQKAVYDKVGSKVREAVLDGDAVVLFAYGLSGSGKTFTVFGPDAVDAPEAWFKHMEPIDMWGLLPRVAFDIFKLKSDGWSIKMKYFQNVVDIVRDLMDPVGKEQSYKAGMKKDKDGFMDIEWCKAVPLKDWKDMTEKFQEANKRKAISPTQFNHQSTRGHCIMVFEIEKPRKDNPQVKSKGRLYVCDLAGTEPAGDIYYAEYTKVVNADGTIDHNLKGKHPNQSKTKELQDQGKKINLSLSEMAQFFMKMADAYKAKKLKAGKSIPGCNSFFLCKYLKDTLLQSKTYLFCAIRPEVTYSRYTFATLGFAKNASVVQLKPKQASVEMSAGERKLMEQLAEMKAMYEALKAEKASGSTDDDGAAARFEAALKNKQAEIERLMMGGGQSQDTNSEDQYLQRQRDDYAKRGISLTHFAKDTKEPYFIAIDEDSYRSRRIMYILEKEQTSFGKKMDIQPLNSSVVKEHCFAKKNTDAVTFIGGKGEVYVNGKKLGKSEEVVLSPCDRVVLGGELLIFHWVGHEGDDAPEMEAQDVMLEYENGVEANRGSGIDAVSAELRAQLKALEEERDKLKAQQNSQIGEAKQNRRTSFIGPVVAIDEDRVITLLKQTKEAQELVNKLRYGMLNFGLSFASQGKLKVQVEHTKTKEMVYLDDHEFVSAISVLRDEQMKLLYAFEESSPYAVPKVHDPLSVLFDKTFNIGSAVVLCEHLAYYLETDEEEDARVKIVRATSPYDDTGALLKIVWTPMADESDENGEKIEEMGDEFDIDDPRQLLGKPWTFRLEITECNNLDLMVDTAYIEYEFFGGERFASAPVQFGAHLDASNAAPTRSPNIDYKYVHHIDSVTEEFLEWLTGTLTVELYVSPFVRLPKERISTGNPEVAKAFEMKPIECPPDADDVEDNLAGSNNNVINDADNDDDGDGGDDDDGAKDPTETIVALKQKLAAKEAENASLKKQLEEALTTIRELQGSGKSKSKIEEARAADRALNG